jgi:23S rRNA A2030 N6-methylase RlmJ
MYTAAELDHYITCLRDLEKDNLADTLTAYVDVVREIAEEGTLPTGEPEARIPAILLEEARRLRPIEVHIMGPA